MHLSLAVHFPRMPKATTNLSDTVAECVPTCSLNILEGKRRGVNIPVLVAPHLRVFRPVVFCPIFPWRQVFP